MDLIPKFLMANGQLVKLLVHTGKHKKNDVLHNTLYLSLSALRIQIRYPGSLAFPLGFGIGFSESLISDPGSPTHISESLALVNIFLGEKYSNSLLIGTHFFLYLSKIK